MSAQEQQLPQEIFDNVIDHFHADFHTLRNCALVSPSWLSSARAHLFHRISLNPPKNTQTIGPTVFFFLRTRTSPCKRLLDCLESSTNTRLGSFAGYIREMHLCEGMLAREWLAHEAMLPPLLRTLHNLRRFEISRSASVRIPWGQLSHELKAALEEHVLRLPSLTEIKLGSVMFDHLEDLAKMLRACRHLRVLDVDHIMFADEGVESLRDLEGNFVKVSLDTLVVGPRTSTALMVYILHPSSAIAVNTVRKLSMSISGNFADFARLLHGSISVEHLELVLMNDVVLQDYWKPSAMGQFDLSRVPHLRNLKVNIDVLQQTDDPLQWLSALLLTGVDSSHPTRRNAIQTIWVVYSLYLPAPYMDRSANTTIFERWSDIDAILSGEEPSEDFDPGREDKHLHAYENLENVKLDFMLENPIGFGVAPRFLKEVVLDSPRLEKRHVLRVNAFDTSK
ncbi:hypothetical protein GALMADRAFT_241132 [Galerina marginata CBS 339.88]|uniref:F-box domain-containing protein n=1 Tax=Galerina marginata (strain CBS 339.88) TaxID=685588 RepID=A0A067TC29_GALM3|nr:hypothetical protein GALMADRAFT_241132 [Galerina marginata CBS 339.88]